MKVLSSIIIFICCCSLPVKAQWAIGLSGGMDYNIPNVTNGYASDVRYKGEYGWDVGVVGRYQFKDWLAIRSDIRLSARNYLMERTIPKLDWVYTKHSDTYIHLPVVADFSFGGSKLRGHLYGGGYIGCWLSARRSGISMGIDINTDGDVWKYSFDENLEFDNRRDQRFNAGLTAGAGVSYAIVHNWELLAECHYLYDVSSSNKTYSVANPRYNGTYMFNLGIMYNF